MLLASPPQSAHVVFRLRLAFLGIALLLAISAIAGGFQLFVLHRSQASAIERSVPALALSQQLQSQLAKFQKHSINLRTEKTTPKLFELHKSLTRLSSEMHVTVNSLTPVSVSQESLLGLSESLRRVTESIDEIAPLRRAQIGIDQHLAEKRIALSSIRSEFRTHVEPRLIDVASSLEASLQPSQANLPIAQASPGRLVSTQVDIQNKLSEISYRVSAVIDMAEQLSKQSPKPVTADEIAQLQLNIRNVAQILITLDANDFRQELAALTKELRGVILDENGIVFQLQASSDYSSTYDGVLKRQLTISGDFSHWIESIVELARSDISTSAAQFHESLFRTIVILAVSWLIIATIIALVSYYVVERQFNRRMTKLTTATLAIAEGDVDFSVDVRGKDELGAVANSLRVFKKNALELRRSNKELELFAYAASHDLKSPLRAIENLAEWTLEDAGDELSDESRGNLVKLLNRARRLSRLQTDLLEYCKAGLAEERIEAMNLPKVVDELSDLLNPDGNYSITVSDQTLLARTYVTPLRQVLLNLINNAIKHHDRSQGMIKISSNYSKLNGRVVITITDDGCGIDPEYHDRIFGLFQTLQPQDVVEGSGMGLSLIQKLVNRYSGTIELTSNPTICRGTTFTFDWPIFHVQPIE